MEGIGSLVHETDGSGHFESEALEPGEYQVKIGEIVAPEDRGHVRISGEPPDLYLPVLYSGRWHIHRKI